MASSINCSRFVEVGRKILAVGRNYKEHAVELGNKLPGKPIIFLKPPSSYILEGTPIKVPQGCKNLQEEVELAVVIGQKASKISEKQAMDCVGGYALALDMTARDFQDEAKNKGYPWTMAKGFDTSCPVSQFIPKDKIPDPQNVTIWCKVNGNMKQCVKTSHMELPIVAILSYISNFITLEPGDLVLTGTPAGVTAVKPGDKIEAGIDGIVTITFNVEGN